MVIRVTKNKIRSIIFHLATMEKLSYLLSSLFLFCLSSCDLLSPDEVLNPNVATTDFVSSPQAMKVWVNGTQANLAVAVSTFAEYTGLLSDDLMNNSSRSSKTYDQLDILYTDNEVFKLSTHIGKLLQMTEFGLNTIAPNDADTRQQELFTLRYIRAYAYILAGENFVALPREARGEILKSEDLLAESLKELRLAETLAETAEQKALIALFKARALRGQGLWADAATQARLSLEYCSDYLLCVQYDALNGYNNSLHEYIAGGLFTIAGQLSFEQDKFPMADYWNQPIAIAKSEEAYLILAEAAIRATEPADASTLTQDLAEARLQIKRLSQLVSLRPAYVSLLSDVSTLVDSATDRNSMLSLIYDLRQQVFFGEARRSNDLGIRLPLSEVEFNEHSNLPQAYTQAIIPAYLLPIRTEIDQHSDISRLLVESL